MLSGKIKDLLLAEISKTKEVMLEYKEMTNPEPTGVAIGRISRMDSINNKNVMQAALRQAEIKL